MSVKRSAEPCAYRLMIMSAVDDTPGASLGISLDDSIPEGAG